MWRRSCLYVCMLKISWAASGCSGRRSRALKVKLLTSVPLHGAVGDQLLWGMVELLARHRLHGECSELKCGSPMILHTYSRSPVKKRTIAPQRPGGFGDDILSKLSMITGQDLSARPALVRPVLRRMWVSLSEPTPKMLYHCLTYEECVLLTGPASSKRHKGTW